MGVRMGVLQTRLHMEDQGLLPDMTAIQDKEIEIPTLHMEPMTLSGIINEHIATIDSGEINRLLHTDTQAQQSQAQQVYLPPTTNYTVPANTIPGQNADITISLVPPEFKLNKPDMKPDFPSRDITDSISGFGQGADWTQPAPEMENIQNAGDYILNQMEQPMQPQKTRAYVEILEQPKSNSLRFRYECEGRSAGALQGINSQADHKTFPKIKVHNYKGPAVVVVSCVTENQPHKAHPHNLVSPRTVGRNGCKKGVCTMNINNDTMTVEFQNLGVQCVRRKDIGKSLTQRKEIRVDPFRQGFKHIENPQAIDLNAVRLCFQVFLEGKTPGKYTEILDPVVSRPVYDAKAKRELQILDISDTESPVEGGKKIILLTDRVSREDIKVRFVDRENNWSAEGEFGPNDVHKQYAISLKTPRYLDMNITEKRLVGVELYKNSNDSEVSEVQDFWYLPSERTKRNSAGMKRDKQTVGLDSGRLDIEYKKNNMYGGGGVYMEEAGNKSQLNQIRIKREAMEPPLDPMDPMAVNTTTWSKMTNAVAPNSHNQPRAPYSQVGYHDGSLLMKDLRTTNPGPQFELPGMMPGRQGVSYNQLNVPNIPVTTHIGQVSPNMSQVSPNIGQVSPNMQARSPQMAVASSSPSQYDQYQAKSPDFGPNYVSSYINSGEINEAEKCLKSLVDNGMVDNLSGKIESTHLDDNPPARDGSTTSKGKRSQKDAALESGSNVVPRQMDRQMSSITTPDCSANLSDIVNSHLNNF